MESANGKECIERRPELWRKMLLLVLVLVLVSGGWETMGSRDGGDGGDGCIWCERIQPQPLSRGRSDSGLPVTQPHSPDIHRLVPKEQELLSLVRCWVGRAAASLKRICWTQDSAGSRRIAAYLDESHYFLLSRFPFQPPFTPWEVPYSRMYPAVRFEFVAEKGFLMPVSSWTCSCFPVLPLQCNVPYEPLSNETGSHVSWVRNFLNKQHWILCRRDKFLGPDKCFPIWSCWFIVFLGFELNVKRSMLHSTTNEAARYPVGNTQTCMCLMTNIR